MTVVIKSNRSDVVLGTKEEGVLRRALQAYAGSKSSVVDGDERKIATRILEFMGRDTEGLTKFQIARGGDTP